MSELSAVQKLKQHRLDSRIKARSNRKLKRISEIHAQKFLNRRREQEIFQSQSCYFLFVVMLKRFACTFMPLKFVSDFWVLAEMYP